jgi:hypothetical protein
MRTMFELLPVDVQDSIRALTADVDDDARWARAYDLLARELGLTMRGERPDGLT